MQCSSVSLIKCSHQGNPECSQNLRTCSGCTLLQSLSCWLTCWLPSRERSRIHLWALSPYLMRSDWVGQILIKQRSHHRGDESSGKKKKRQKTPCVTSAPFSDVCVQGKSAFQASVHHMTLQYWVNIAQRCSLQPCVVLGSCSQWWEALAGVTLIWAHVSCSLLEASIKIKHSWYIQT